jgi:hypothetical protein
VASAFRKLELRRRAGWHRHRRNRRQSEGAQDRVRHFGLGDERDHAHATFALVALQDIDLVHARKQCSPIESAWPHRWTVDKRGETCIDRSSIFGCNRYAQWCLRYDPRAQLGVWRKATVVLHRVHARWWNDVVTDAVRRERQAPDESELLTVDQYAREKKLTTASVYKALSRGQIKAVRVGRRVRIARVTCPQKTKTFSS